MLGNLNMLDLGNEGINLLQLVVSVATLVVCIVYRRLSGSMVLLLLAAVAGIFSALLFIALWFASRFLEYGEVLSAADFLANLIGLAAGILTVVGLFAVFADVSRKLRRRGDDFPDDFGRFPPPRENDPGYPRPRNEGRRDIQY
jgi:hypothetical protein